MNGGVNVTAIGYNKVDGRLYGVQSNPPYVLSIDSVGGVTPLLPLPVDTRTYDCADVDEKGHMWIAAAGQKWYQIDLNPRVPVVLATDTASPTSPVTDWAFVPGGGDFLYAVVVTTGSRVVLSRFDRGFKTWFQYGTIYASTPNTNRFGAAFAATDGFLYASDEQYARLYRFNLDGKTVENRGAPLGTYSTGAGAFTDGAHCIDSSI